MAKMLAPDSSSFILTAYQYIMKITSDIAGKVRGVGYQTVHNLLYGGVGYTIVGLIVMFWLMNQLKSGSITREEMYKAGTWVVLTCFVFGVMATPGAYEEFVSWFTIPENWFRGAVAGAMGGWGVTSIMSGINSQYENYYFVANNAIWDNYYKTSEAEFLGMDFKDDHANIKTGLDMIPIWLLMIPIWIFLIGLGTVDVITNLTSNVLLGLAPGLVPCIIYSKLRPYFFSWLKLYVAISLYLPVCMLIGGMGKGALSMMPPPASLVSSSTTAAAFIPAVAFILAAVMLLKVPGWIHAIFGVSDGNSGVGGSLATVAAGAAVLGKFGGTVGKAIAGAVRTGTNGLSRQMVGQDAIGPAKRRQRQGSIPGGGGGGGLMNSLASGAVEGVGFGIGSSAFNAVGKHYLPKSMIPE